MQAYCNSAPMANDWKNVVSRFKALTILSDGHAYWMSPHEINENAHIYKEAEQRYHNVCVVFLPNWPYDEYLNDTKRGLCGHTAIQHQQFMTEKTSSASSRYSPYYLIPSLEPPMHISDNAFIAIGTVHGALWAFDLLIRTQRSTQNIVCPWLS